MKRFLIISALLGLFFASCSYDASDTSQTGTKPKQKNEEQKLQLFSFVLDEDFVTQIRQESGITDSNSVTVRIEFTGGYEATDTKTLRFSELEGASFSFSEIPLNKAFTIKIFVYHGSVLKYEAIKKDVLLENSGQNDLSMVLKNSFVFNDTTKLVLYSKQTSVRTAYDLYSLDKESDNPSSSFGYADFNFRYFFDAPGNIWYLTDDGSGSNNYKARRIKSSDGKEIVPLDDPEVYIYKAFTSSRESNTLYAIGFSRENTDAIYLCKFPYAFNDLTLKNKQVFELKGITSREMEYSSQMIKFVVFNDGFTEKVYILTCTRGAEPVDTAFHIFEFDLSEVKDGDAVTGIDKINLTANVDNVYLSQDTLTDMIYQDGAVYFLVRDVSLSSSFPNWSAGGEITSRGALLKYDVSTGLVSTLGFSSESVENTVFNKSDPDNPTSVDDSIGMNFYYYDGVNYNMLYTTSALTTEKIVTGGSWYDGNNDTRFFKRFPSLYTPSPNNSTVSKTCFYGPGKFIGIKPKKLVIADDGIAFYTDNDVLLFKNVNRVVTVDLETFVITGDPQNTTASFEGDFASLISSSSTTGAGSGYDSTSVYYSNGASVEELSSGVNKEKFFIGIKNGDSN